MTIPFATTRCVCPAPCAALTHTKHQQKTLCRCNDDCTCGFDKSPPERTFMEEVDAGRRYMQAQEQKKAEEFAKTRATARDVAARTVQQLDEQIVKRAYAEPTLSDLKETLIRADRTRAYDQGYRDGIEAAMKLIAGGQNAR
jgi:hypothetical protein